MKTKLFFMSCALLLPLARAQAAPEAEPQFVCMNPGTVQVHKDDLSGVLFEAGNGEAVEVQRQPVAQTRQINGATFIFVYTTFPDRGTSGWIAENYVKTKAGCNAPATAPKQFHCIGDNDAYHFDAVGSMVNGVAAGPVQGIVSKAGRPFQNATAPAASSAFVPNQQLAFTAKSLLVQVAVNAKFTAGVGYAGTMSVTSFLGNTPLMNTVCITH